MSIEITYRKAVIKLQDGRTLPILESGSSNCFDVLPNGRSGRRERSRGLLTKLIGTQDSIEPYVKGWVQRYIDDNENLDYQQWTDQTWKNMDSGYRASRRFPGRINLGQVIKYVTRPNIDLDIADQYITLRVQGGSEYVKPSDIDKLLNGTAVRLEVSGVDYAIREQAKRNKAVAMSKPKVVKPAGNYVVKIGGYSNAFVYKLGARRLRHSSEPCRAKKFDSIAQATKWIDKHDLVKRFSCEFIPVAIV